MHEGVQRLLTDRYFWRWNIDGKEIVETPQMVFLRVAKKMASAFLNILNKSDMIGTGESKDKIEKLIDLATGFYNIMNSGDFMPSSPQLFNALRGIDETQDNFNLIYKPIKDTTFAEWKTLNAFKNPIAAYGSCYAMGRVGDSIEEIYDSLKEQAVIFKAAGGYGASFSNLRSEGTSVKTTRGQSCGPVEFMELFNMNTKKIALSGQLKRGANMFSLSVSHPDIETFIDKKEEFIIDEEDGMLRSKHLEHANLSVEVSDEFIDAVKNDLDWELIDPHTKEVKKVVKAKNLYKKIIDSAYKSGEPGILMLSTINKYNPIRDLEPITSVNPCVTGDTLVPTTEGLIRADSLKKGMFTWNPIKNKMEEITAVYNNGVKDIYEITLENGMKLKATSDHKLKTQSGDLVALQNLSTNDILEISLNDVLKFVKKSTIPSFEQEEKSLTNNILKTFTFTNPLDISWFIGVMIGDGTIYSNYNDGTYTTTLTIGKTKKNVHANIERILKNMKVTYRIIETPTSTLQFVVTGKNFTKYIAYLMEIIEDDNNNLRTSNNKKIPTWVFTSSKDIVLSFIAGLLDSDGTVNITKKGSNIAISSIYQTLLSKLQQLLMAAGVSSHISVLREKKNLIDPRTKKIYLSKKIWRLTFSTVNKKALSDIEKFMYCTHKKENMQKIITMKGPNSTYYINKSKFVKIKSIEKIGQDVVYDITVPDDFMWVTNGFISLDCSEYLGFSNTVCNLGSINLYNFVDYKTKMLDTKRLDSVISLAVTYLNLALMANSLPTEKLTKRSMELRPIGLGFMGLGSTLARLGYRYGSKESLDFTKDFVQDFMYYVIKASHHFSVLSDTRFKHYEYSDYAKGEFVFKNEKHKDKISKLLKMGITNSRLSAIAPNGSISKLVVAAMKTPASSVSGGLEPIFSPIYTRRVNPDTPQEYIINEMDVAVYDILKERGYTDEQITEFANDEEAIEKLSEEIGTVNTISVEDHLNIFQIVTEAIDMQASKTVNVPATYTKEDLYNLYLDAYDRGAKGLTVYVDGSREGILNHVKHSKQPEFILDLNLTKQGKILPKERPTIINSLKKTVKFSEEGKDVVSVVNIEVGFDDNNSPFEVFIRSTTTTKEYTELFNAMGRLISLALRSNADMDTILKQTRKIKDWKNNYSNMAMIIASTISELVEIGKSKSKKKRTETIKEINKHKFMATAKGYLVDTTTGEKYCPVCYAKEGEGLQIGSGCLNCDVCGWGGCGG